MASPKPCKNSSAHTYTGKDNSPLGVGYCAAAESVGTLMEGRDKKLYMVTMKNGIKQWSQVNDSIALAILKKDIPLLTEDDVIMKKTEETKKAKPVSPVREKSPSPTPAQTVAASPPPQENSDAKPEKKEKTAKTERKKPGPKAAKNTTTKEEPAPDQEPPKATKPPKATEPEAVEPPKATEPLKAAKPKKAAKEPKEPKGEKVEKEKKTKAPSEYNLFVKEIIPKLREEFPGLKASDYIKKASERWQANKA